MFEMLDSQNEIKETPKEQENENNSLPKEININGVIYVRKNWLLFGVIWSNDMYLYIFTYILW